ncbi:hypothetical protein MKW92_001044 [Papaver armeniacum]|nr:hypothetical protein MKW92_001044 [Papaver armeniacum]
MDENPQPPAAKKVRGGAKLNFLNKLKKGEKVSLEFCRGAPVGPNANKISAYYWSDMPHKEEKLEEAIEELKNIFHYSDEINFWVEEKIHEKWKANKRNMRLEHFDEKKTDAQNRANCPNEVIDTQWANMLIYWRSPEFKKKSENGKASRKRLVMPHHGGTKSFVNHAIEIEETTQKKASRVAVYQKTYRAKEGKTPNPIAEANRLKGDKYSKIMGAEKPGRIRGVGSAIKEDRVHMRNDMEEERLEMKKIVDEMKKANEESREKIDAFLLFFFFGRRDLPHPEP